MKLGLHRAEVAVEPHNCEWEITATHTIAKLKAILKDHIIDAQHIGSTSIKDICAKPIIDIVVGAADLNRLLAMNDVLAVNGFIFRGQDLPDQYLYVCGSGDIRTHHIHAVIHDSEIWNNYINMRDYLNCHKADAQAYSELKISLAKQYPHDRITYTEMKSRLISEILAKAQNWRKGLLP